MNKNEKTQAISELEAAIGKARNAFLIDFKGVTVPQVTELRKQVRETGSKYLVVKNTLALIALKDSPMIGMKDRFSGPTAVAFNSIYSVKLSKAMIRYATVDPAMLLM